MSSRNLKSIGKRTLATLLALCMSLMMVPAVAFADDDSEETFEVLVDASEGDASYTTGEDVAATYNPAVGVIARFENTAEAVLGNVTSNSMKHSVMVETDNGGTANVTMGDVTDTYRWAGNGVDASATGGNIELNAENVKASKVGLNLVNDSTNAASELPGKIAVIVNSVTQTEDSRYADAGINAFSYASGDSNNVKVKGDVNAAGSRAIDVLAKGESETSVTVGGMVNANYLGVKIEAGCLGNVNGTTVSTGTAIVRVGGVESKKYDQAVVIDSNTKGSTATFQSDGDVKALASGSTGIFTRADGGKSIIIVDGNVSGTQTGLQIYCTEVGSNDVLVTGTISGKNGVDISYDSVANDSLTVWKIEKAENGQYVSSEWNNVPSDDREIFAKKRINYIAYVENLVEGVALVVSKADGSALDKRQGYDVAREGDKIIVKVNLESGYELKGVYNGKGDLTELLKDENGNYYYVVPRGGGIYLSAVLEDMGEGLNVMPPIEALIPSEAEAAVAASAADEPNGNNASIADARWPLLTYDGVEINDVKLEMDGQTPILRTTLTNTNGRDVKFDCTKFKIVNVDDDSEIAFKTEAKELKANETSVKCEFKAEANAMKAGDRAYVFYDSQLLGTFTVA